MGIMIGNQSVEQIKNRIGIKFPDEIKIVRKKTRRIKNELYRNNNYNFTYSFFHSIYYVN